MSFSASLAITLAFEGGKADNKQDPGGRTNYGITQAVYDPSRKRDVFDITMPEVTAIYYNNYWVPAKCDPINAYNEDLACAHFDACVNTGVHQGAILLQRSAHVATDGIIGWKTLLACQDDPNAVVHELVARRNFYALLIEKKPALAVWANNWNHRVTTLAMHLGVTLPSG